MSQKLDPERLKRLEDRLAKARGDDTPVPAQKEEHHITQAQVAWRMVTELVTGLLLGFGIGYGIDQWLGSAPWAMIVMTMFGFAAGVKTMMRTAQEVQKKQSDQKITQE